MKCFFMFLIVSIGISLLIYIISGGHILFLIGGIPLVFGGFWSFGGKRQKE